MKAVSIQSPTCLCMQLPVTYPNHPVQSGREMDYGPLSILVFFKNPFICVVARDFVNTGHHSADGCMVYEAHYSFSHACVTSFTDMSPL